MDKTLFIPSKIKVGYQKRGDTYTKKLAYVIYYDEKGKLRKETSWEGWRDKTIPADEFENKPHSGFVLNKDVQRSGEWFGSGRNMIRVYDDRGIEFEITCDNLMYILMTTNCVKRGLEGEFVYAWEGKELILLPTGCEEYESSVKYTENKAKKIKAKELVAGCSYKTKEMQDLIYLGKFDYFTFGYSKSYTYPKIQNVQKMYIFSDVNKNIRPFAALSSFTIQNSNTPISNYAEFMQVFSDSIHSSSIEELIHRPSFDTLEEFINNTNKNEYNYHSSQQFFIKEKDNEYKMIQISVQHDSKYDNVNQKYTSKFVGYRKTLYYDITFHNKNLEINYSPERNTQNSLRDVWGRVITPYLQAEDLRRMKFYDIFVLMKNGKEFPITKFI